MAPRLCRFCELDPAHERAICVECLDARLRAAPRSDRTARASQERSRDPHAFVARDYDEILRALGHPDLAGSNSFARPIEIREFVVDANSNSEAPARPVRSVPGLRVATEPGWAMGSAVMASASSLEARPQSFNDCARRSRSRPERYLLRAVPQHRLATRLKVRAAPRPTRRRATQLTGPTASRFLLDGGNGGSVPRSVNAKDRPMTRRTPACSRQETGVGE